MDRRPEHEKLLVYARAIALAEALDVLAEAIPERRADLRDQLRRASASVPLNIAEGAGEFSPAEKARFYRVARRSTAECSAILDVVGRLNDRPALPAEAREHILEVAAMLTKMVLRMEDRRR